MGERTVFSASLPDLAAPVPFAVTIPRAFHPPSSALGRWVRCRARDARHAESLFIVAAALVLTVATLASQWSWILLGEAAPGDALALGVLAAHGLGGGLLAWGCLWGWKPAITVTADSEALEARQGSDTLHLGYGAIDRAERITAEAYHRHWRRYAATRAFVNRLPDDLLLLRTDDGPVVLGLAPADLDRLEARLAEGLEVEAGGSLVRAA